VEFDAQSHRAVLAKAGIQPAELYDGTGYLTPLIEAEIVGFGLFGFSASPALADRFQPYAGRTRVSYGDWRGSKGFLHWSPPRKAGHGPHPDPLSNNVQFTLVQEPIKATNPFDQSPIPIWSHPQQALITSGDSGGPLLFRSQGKTKVAGISSSIYGEFLYLGLELVPFHLQIWEPVKDSLEWIHGVMAGNAKASSRVVELGKDEAKAGSGQHGERMASELANEGFAMPCPCVIL